MAHGYFLISAAAGLFVDPDYGPVLGNYGLDALRFVKPVKPGDRIQVRLTCREKSLRADKGWGEVTWDTEITQPGRRDGRRLPRADDGQRACSPDAVKDRIVTIDTGRYDAISRASVSSRPRTACSRS